MAQSKRDQRGEKNEKTGREKQERDKQGGGGGKRGGGGGQKRADRKQ